MQWLVIAARKSLSRHRESGKDKKMANPKLAKAFQNGKIFIPFISCGDPTVETTKAIVRELAAAGAGIIELGIPFSDPTAEGPVIQGANLRALTNGINTDKVFAMAKELTAEIDTPMVFMTYGNVVYHYGIERFAKNAAEAGICGIILPDVPYEEKGEFFDIFAEQGIDLISMIAPTSEDRIAMIASEAQGFIYLVSSLGVTGTRTEITTDLGSIIAKIREVTDTPVAIGFGISNPEQAKKMASLADGAIIGSAIVKMVGAYGEEAAPEVGKFAQAVVAAVNEA